MGDGLETCLECSGSQTPQAGTAIWGEHDGALRTAVLALKYGRRDDLATPLGRRLAARVATAPWVDDLDVVSWVPSHVLRRVRRPWPAAELLAHEVARALELPARTLLVRRGLRRQTGSSRSRRLQLSSHSFRAHRSQRGATVLLVDDVTTTGATIRRAAAAVRAAGAAAVYCAVLAQTSDSRRVT
jgi:predicted amidophosphoribosyltransferase